MSSHTDSSVRETASFDKSHLSPSIPLSFSLSLFLFLGQFWNVPVTAQEFTGLFENEMRNDDYVITVRYPGGTPRRFIGMLSDVTWEFEKRPCYFVGNGQGGKLSREEVAPPDPNDSVIEGHYSDYAVDFLFSTGYKYSRFNDDRCTNSV